MPDAANTATPAACSAATAFAVALPVHGDTEELAYSPPSPRLMLTIRTPAAAPPGPSSLSTQSRPAAASEKFPLPLLSSTFTATIFASGATPSGATAPAEVMIPDTLVPWPKSSSALVSSFVPPGQQPNSRPEQKQCCAAMSFARSG